MKPRFKLASVLFLAILFALMGCGKDPIPEDPKELSVLGEWEDGGDGVYTITTNTAEILAFTYAKSTKPDAYMEKDIEEDLSIFKKLVVTVKGMGSIKIELMNADGTSVKKVELNVAAIEGTYEWNLLNASDFLKNVKKIRITGAPGKEASNGNVEISKMKFYDVVADGYIIQDNFNNIPNNVNEYNGTDENFNFNAKWERFVATEEIYNISVDGEVTHVEVKKEGTGAWACINALVKGDFSKFNYVVVVVKGTSGMPLVAKAANGFETKIILNGTEQTVAVDISSMTTEQKNSIASIILFGYAGVPNGDGYFDILEGYMTEEFDTGIVKNVYNGTDATFSIINWYDTGEQTYTFAVNETDTVVNFNKGNDTLKWSRAESYIEGDISKFENIRIVITGENGKKAMFKIEGGGENIEKNIEFDGTKQTIDMNIFSMSEEALKAVNKVMLFAQPGETGTGSFTVHSVTFMAHEYDFNNGWVDNGDGIYTFTENEDGTVTVHYNKPAGKAWPLMKKVFAEGETEGYNTMTIVLQGVDGKEILVKPNDQGLLEKRLTFEQDIDAVFTAAADKFVSVLIFMEPNVDNVTGSFTIVSAKLGYERPVITDPLPEADVNSNWVDNGNGVYTFTENTDGTVTVNYDKTVGEGGFAWATMKQVFAGDLLGYNRLTIVLRGTTGKKVLVKLNDQIETWVEFDESGDKTVVTTADKITSLFIFGEGGVADAIGSFTIVSCTLSDEPNVNSDWVDNGDGVYTFTKNADGTVTVNYDKTVGTGGFAWSTMKREFKDKLSIYNTFHIVLRGTTGKKVLVKVNNQIETWVEFDETGDKTVTTTAEKITSVFLFGEGGVADVTGSFTIVSAYLSFEKPDMDVNSNWVDNGDGVYTFTDNTDGTVTVNYDKTAGENGFAWATMKQDFTGSLGGYKTLTIVLRGTEGKKVLVKLNNSIETWVEFGASGDKTVVTSADAITSVLLFAEGGVADVTGSFTIVSAQLSMDLPQ